MNQSKKLLLILCLLLGSLNLMSQNKILKGKIIVAKENTPVSGATIAVKGTTHSVIASSDGTFSIPVSSSGVTLVITSIGYNKREFVVDANQNNIIIPLETNEGLLGEVVVTALGITRQAKTLVYATQIVKPADLTEARDPNNIINSLQGKIANAVINQGSGGMPPSMIYLHPTS